MTKKLKNVKLRHNEYYDMQDVFDGLYQSSVGGKSFKNLMRHITCENNIMLAYRNIKKNAGSNTMGTVVNLRKSPIITCQLSAVKVQTSCTFCSFLCLPADDTIHHIP